MGWRGQGSKLGIFVVARCRQVSHAKHLANIFLMYIFRIYVYIYFLVQIISGVDIVDQPNQLYVNAVCAVREHVRHHKP